MIDKWLIQPRPRVYSKFLVEFIACMMFHFLGSVSATPVSNGIVLMVLVYYTAKTSGAHLNPAVSLTFTLLGYTNPLELLFYWTAQICGCALGALWLALLVPNQMIRHGTIGCFEPTEGLGRGAIFGWEAICTFTFIVPIFSVVWYTTHKKGYGNTGPLLVGLSLIASALAAGPYTGAALNPARVLGSIIVFECPESSVKTSWLYILGELTGAIIAPLAIMPWFGICNEAWYIDWLPSSIKSNLLIIFRTMLVHDDTMDNKTRLKEIIMKLTHIKHSQSSADESV